MAGDEELRRLRCLHPQADRDLLARLSGMSFALPPLRARLEDLGLLVATFLDEHQPQSQTELDLVHTLAVASWRLRRLRAMETGLIELRLVDYEEDFDKGYTSLRPHERLAFVFARNTEQFNTLSRYEGRIERSFYRALHEGRSRDGRPLVPAFPYTSYTLLTREDSDAIHAYLAQRLVLDPGLPEPWRGGLLAAIVPSAWLESAEFGAAINELVRLHRANAQLETVRLSPRSKLFPSKPSPT